MATLDRGGTAVIAGIHLTEVPPLDHRRHLFDERQLAASPRTRATTPQLLALAASTGLSRRDDAVPARAGRRGARRASRPAGCTAPPYCSPDPAGHQPDPGAGRPGFVAAHGAAGRGRGDGRRARWSRCPRAIDLSTLPTLHGALGHVITDAADRGRDGGPRRGQLARRRRPRRPPGAPGRARRSDGDLVVVCSDPDRRARLAVTGFDRAVTVRSALDAR